jgi:hypothetical protein
MKRSCYVKETDIMKIRGEGRTNSSAEKGAPEDFMRCCVPLSVQI